MTDSTPFPSFVSFMSCGIVASSSDLTDGWMAVKTQENTEETSWWVGFHSLTIFRMRHEWEPCRRNIRETMDGQTDNTGVRV
jgi:hypothetical protein